MENSRECHTHIDDPSSLHRLSSSQSHSGSSSPFFAAVEEAQNENDQATTAEKVKMRFLVKNRENTWVVSLLVLLHLAAFATTMFVNNYWKFSHVDCSLGFLGRLSFQPFCENPLLGPSFST